MRRLVGALIGVIVGACSGQPPASSSSPVAGEVAESEDFDPYGTFGDHTPYRGHAPFAAVLYNPAYDINTFVLRFYNYWTGFEDRGDAQRHVLVRRTSQSEQGGKFLPVDEWADSQTCLPLPELMKSFSASLPSGTEGLTAQGWEPKRYSSKEAEQAAALNRPIGHCNCLDAWASLSEDVEPGVIGRSLEIQTSGYLVDSELGRWTKRLLTEASACFSTTPPEVPLQPAQSPDGR